MSICFVDCFTSAVLFNLFDVNGNEEVSKNQFKSVALALLEMRADADFNPKPLAKMVDAYVFFAFLNVRSPPTR